jgi:hypothetical protein
MGLELRQMVSIANALMYEAKQGGRGRIEHESWPPENLRPVGWPGPSDARGA